MSTKFSEMIATRSDLALSLEAGFDNYLDAIGGGYGEFLAPELEDGETPLDARFQIVLLRRSVQHNRERLESLDQGLVEQTGGDGKVRVKIQKRMDAFVGKLRRVRSTCRGVFGRKSVVRVGLQGRFPEGLSRLHRLGVTVKTNLENPELGLEPLLDIDLGTEETPSIPARLARQLDPELTELGLLVADRHQERRKTVAIRLQRRELIRTFDVNIRGIVRMAQGMSMLAGHPDLGRRFRPVLQRVLRKLKARAAEEGAETAAEAAEPQSADPASPPQPDEPAAPAETTA